MKLVLALGLAKGKGGAAGAPPVTDTAPAQFAGGGWTVTDLATEGDIRIAISALPDDGGSPITALEYQVDGGAWVSLGGTGTGNYDRSGFTDAVQVAIAIRAVNLIGNGVASASKNVTPTARVISITAGKGYAGSTYTSTTAGQWTADAVNIGGETGATYVLSRANEGKAIRCVGSNTIEMWLPTDLGADLVAWWDARTGITLNVSDVSSWADVKNGWAAAQGTGGLQPAFSSSGLSSKSAVVFTRANGDLLDVSSGSARAQPFTRAVLCQTTANNVNQRAFDGVAASDAKIAVTSSGSAFFMNAGAGVTGVTFTINTPQVVLGHFNTTSSVLRQKGADTGSGTAGTRSSKVARIGNDLAGGTTLAWDGPIAQVVDCAFLDATKTALLEGFLTHAYELGDTYLAVGHTYRSTAPRIS